MLTIDSAIRDDIAAVVERHGAERTSLIPILQDIKKEHSEITDDAMQVVADMLDIHPVEVYSVATFYKGFSLEPRGVHHVQVCRGTTCHLHGGTRLQEGVIRRLGIEPGQTTPDGQFSLEQVKCVGKCGAAPVLAVDADYFGEVGVDGVTKILRTYRKPK